MERYLDPQDAVAHSQPLVSGRDLISGLQLSPGPRLVSCSKPFNLAQAEGLVTTRAEALESGLKGKLSQTQRLAVANGIPWRFMTLAIVCPSKILIPNTIGNIYGMVAKQYVTVLGDNVWP
jgi:hypothetical protein